LKLSKRRLKDVLKTSYVPIYYVYEASYRHPIFIFETSFRRLLDILFFYFDIFLRRHMDVLFFSFMTFSRRLFFDLTFICTYWSRSAKCLFYNCWNKFFLL